MRRSGGRKLPNDGRQKSPAAPPLRVMQFLQARRLRSAGRCFSQEARRRRQTMAAAEPGVTQQVTNDRFAQAADDRRA
jgi:hypothetical protein